MRGACEVRYHSTAFARARGPMRDSMVFARAMTLGCADGECPSMSKEVGLVLGESLHARSISSSRRRNGLGVNETVRHTGSQNDTV